MPALLVDLGGRTLSICTDSDRLPLAAVKAIVQEREGVPAEIQRLLLLSGRQLDDDAVVALAGPAAEEPHVVASCCCPTAAADSRAQVAPGVVAARHLRLALSLPGGKGGFGSMLRALGAQRSGAETDNIEACRGLDGRRLRFTNDEKKIAEWTAKQEERQREAEAKKKAKRERELQEPKHTFDHHSFSITVHEQCATVNEAVAAALKKHPEAASDDLKGTGKHAASEPAAAPAKKARLLWSEDWEEDVSSGDSDEDDEEEEEGKGAAAATAASKAKSNGKGKTPAAAAPSKAAASASAAASSSSASSSASASSSSKSASATASAQKPQSAKTK